MEGVTVGDLLGTEINFFYPMPVAGILACLDFVLSVFWPVGISACQDYDPDPL